MAALFRIEALPGDRRYAVSFERADGSEQTAVVHLGDDGVSVAEASLPAGWSRGSRAWQATAAAVTAFDEARRHAPAAPALRDVEGGWDVSLGNVVLGKTGVHCARRDDQVGRRVPLPGVLRTRGTDLTFRPDFPAAASTHRRRSACRIAKYLLRLAIFMLCAQSCAIARDLLQV
jgi:hypothetical protein